ncbi:MAG: ABC transporter permease subunit [Kiloniellales bacterium]|nr:ABC transporter permease subunit [Kiloniellales bacterium]MDJ0968358.1 ABC transporter permease subunit [Kiloniellales bacterium]MDJ0981223.1 ABC transporter permease subunit [Kiloniellales bacterium]
MAGTLTILRRELAGYFTSPLAYVFITIFLMLSGALTFYLGSFFQRGQADLQAFFLFHPWLYLFLIPAVAMRLWAEERKTGTIEFLMTLPISTGQAVAGKFLAAWVFAGIALLLTFPIWVTVNVLGTPDNGVILATYLASWLMAGGFLAIGACLSAVTRNQVIAFVLAAAVCFVFNLAGIELVQNFLRAWTPSFFADAVGSFSFLSNYQAISQGVIDLRHLLFFGSLIGIALLINTLIVDLRKGI